MIITRKLKYIEFEFDEETKEFRICKDKVYFAISRVYAVALLRFIVRILARGFYRKYVKQNKRIN